MQKIIYTANRDRDSKEDTTELGDTLTLIQTMTGLVGVLVILWGLAQIQQAGRRRDREIDVMTETLRESTERQA